MDSEVVVFVERMKHITCRPLKAVDRIFARTPGAPPNRSLFSFFSRVLGPGMCLDGSPTPCENPKIRNAVANIFHLLQNPQAKPMG